VKTAGSAPDSNWLHSCINVFWKNQQFPQGRKPATLLALDGAAKAKSDKV